MSKKASKWNGGGLRVDAAQVEDDRQVLKAGKWRRVQDECSEAEYIERRKERAGFRKGARVRR